MKFNLSGKVRRLQGWWRGQMFKIAAAKILLEIFWLECEQTYCKGVTLVSTSQNVDFNSPTDPIKFKRSASNILSPTSPKNSRKVEISNSSLVNVKKSDFNFAAGHSRKGSNINTKKLMVDKSIFTKKRKLQVLENKRAELLKNFHDYLIDPARRHSVINDYLTEKRYLNFFYFCNNYRRDYRIYLKRHQQQVKNWLIYNKEAIEVQKMKFALQSEGIPNVEEIKKLLGCPQQKEFLILPSKEEMLDMIDFAFKKQKSSAKAV